MILQLKRLIFTRCPEQKDGSEPSWNTQIQFLILSMNSAQSSMLDIHSLFTAGIGCKRISSRFPPPSAGELLLGDPLSDISRDVRVPCQIRHLCHVWPCLVWWPPGQKSAVRYLPWCSNPVSDQLCKPCLTMFFTADLVHIVKHDLKTIFLRRFNDKKHNPISNFRWRQPV